MSELQAQNTNVADLAQRINTEHRACEEAATSAVEHAMNAGDMLSEVKASLKHGEFGPWLAANFEGTRRTAQVYMQLAQNRETLNAQHAAHLSIRGALAELSAPAVEEANEADERQAGQEDLSDEETRELITEYVRAWAPAISDIEWQAVERRLESPTDKEQDLLKDLQVNWLYLLASQAHVEGFFFEPAADGEMLLSYRDEQIRWVPLPTNDEGLRELVRRGSRQHAFYDFKNIRRIANWLTQVVAAECSDMDTIERRMVHNRDWRPGEAVADYLWDRERDKPGHKKADYKEKARHPELTFDQLVQGVDVWISLRARSIEKYIFGGGGEALA